MSQRFKIETLLNDAHFDELQSYLAQRPRTVDGVLEWITQRGYQLSRSAAWNYMTAQQQLAAPVLIPRDEDDRRKMVIACARRLRGKELHAMATFAAFLASGSPVKKKGNVRRPI